MCNNNKTEGENTKKNNTTFLDVIPLDVSMYIWKNYFTSYVLNEIRNRDPAKLWTEPTRNLCNLCNDIGCLQAGENIDNLVFSLFNVNGCDLCQNKFHDCIEENCEHFETFTLNEKKKINCGNCMDYGFPCLNCGTYFSENIGFIGMWNCEDMRSTNFKRIHMLLKEDYMENGKFDQKSFEYDALNNIDQAYYPEN